MKIAHFGRCVLTLRRIGNGGYDRLMTLQGCSALFTAILRLLVIGRTLFGRLSTNTQLQTLPGRGMSDDGGCS